MIETDKSSIRAKPNNSLIHLAARKLFFQSKHASPLSRASSDNERIHECGLVEELVSVPSDPNVRTIYDVLLRGLRVSNNGPYLGERDANGNYCWLDYKNVVENAQFVGSALIKLGLQIGQDTRVAAAGLHSSKYITVGHALSTYSMVFVPLYYNYKLDDLTKIINKCRIEVLFCDTWQRARDYIDRIEEFLTLKHVILMKSDKDKPDDLVGNSRIKIHTWESILGLGKNNLQPPNPPKPTDVYVICYTSGTTGVPKGAMISHQALLATVTGPTIQWFGIDQGLKIGAEDIYFSFLPPAHLYEQLMEMLTSYYGARIGIFSGNNAKLVDDLQALQPTFAAFVPRVLIKLEAQIKAHLQQKNRLVQKIFDIALKLKIRELRAGIVNYNTVWDRTVFKPVHKLVGNRLRFIITGGASIPANVKYFSAAVYGCPVFEGYGQSESAAAATLTTVGDTTVGHVGIPSPWAQIKLVSVPELDYYSENNEGEIYLRGAGLMNGYFEEPELTSQVFDNEGWLKTGDIGRWRPSGTLELIDRKTHFFKLSQGDFVSPESVERVYQTCPLISQIFVTGRQTESYMVAIVVPRIDNIREIVEQDDKVSHLSKAETTAELLLQDKQVRLLVLEHIRQFGKNKGLSELEQIRNLHFEINEFTPDNSLLTPTLKMKRLLISQKYASVIDTMYAENLI